MKTSLLKAFSHSFSRTTLTLAKGCL